MREWIRRMAWLAASTWIGLRLGLQRGVRETTVATVGALGVMLALRIAWRAPHARVEATPDGLRVAGPDGERAIPWAAVERVRLAAGEVTTARGVVRVSYAQVDVAHGRPVAFADLTPLGSPRLRTVEGDAPVLDVGDPELLLGAIAERVDAREFLPPEGGHGAAEPAGPWIRASPLAALRLAVAALLAQRAAALVADIDALTAACAGATAVVGPCLVARAALQRRHASPEESSPAALVAASAAALAVAALGPREVGAWSLAAALALALPAWPLPGAWLARRAGRLLAGAPDALGAALVAALGVAAAWGYGLGHVLLPTALVAGGLEAAEGLAASRRHARLASLPRFRHWPPVDLARLRSSLRPVGPDEIGVDLSAVDVVELRDASVAPPRPALAPVAAALVAVALVGYAAAVGAARWAPAARAPIASLGR
ncbi:MAG: PH domain-containing protein [Polyangiales bacterium]